MFLHLFLNFEQNRASRSYKKISWFAASLFDVQQLKRQCEASTVWAGWLEDPKDAFAVSRPRLHSE